MNKTTLIGISMVALLAAGIGGYALSEGGHDHGTKPHAEGDGHDHGAEREGHAHADGEEEEESDIHLSAAQIAAAGITLAPAQAGDVAAEVRVSGTLVEDADRLAHVTTRLPGVVAELHKRLGDPVAAGEVLAVLDSRELADAKADYLAALKREALAAANGKREEELWRKRISAEQDYLDARTTAQTERIALDSARQRLAALGLSAAEIAALPGQDPRSLARLELRTPIAGRVTGRNAVRGELVAADQELFTIADLSRVWVDIPVYRDDMAQVRDGQMVYLTGPGGRQGQGRLIFASPTIDPATGAARAVAELDNPDGVWRPGDFVSGMISAGGTPAAVTVPAEALQTLAGKDVVFVHDGDGFQPRAVSIGRRNSRVVEITDGLYEGETIAAAKSFVLKAVASRGAASHSHSH